MKLEKRSGMLKVVVAIIIIAIIGVAIYFAFTSQGNADFRALKENIEAWSKKVSANRNAISAAENMLSDFEKEKTSAMKEYTIEKTEYEKTKEKINGLVEEYDLRKKQQEILSTGLDSSTELWENDNSVIINIGGQSVSAKKHSENLELINEKLNNINELYQVYNEKIKFQKNNVELLEEKINKITRDKRDWEIKIEKFKVQLAQNEKILNQFSNDFEKSSKSSYQNLMEEAEKISEAFDQLELEGETITEFSKSIPDYSINIANSNDTESETDLSELPEKLSPIN